MQVIGTRNKLGEKDRRVLFSFSTRVYSLFLLPVLFVLCNGSLNYNTINFNFVENAPPIENLGDISNIKGKLFLHISYIQHAGYHYS